MKKKIIIVLIMISLLINITGCSNETLTNDEEYIPLEKYLGIDYSTLRDSQIDELNIIYNKISNFQGDYDSDEYYDLLDEFDQVLYSFGVDVPFMSLTQIIETMKDTFSEEDYNKLLKLDERYNELNYELDGEEKEDSKEILELNEIDEKIGTIFEKYEIDINEIWSQLDNYAVQLALFDISNKEITLSEKSIKKIDAINKEELDLYNKIWNHLRILLPDEYMSLFTKFEINTDGYENIMAYVDTEDEENLQWRITVDIRDALKSDGSFNDEFDITAVHEIAHVLTLNKNQMYDGTDELDTYTVEEGTLKKDSYLNLFYQKFWTDIISEHGKTVKNDEDVDGVAKFHEKYSDRFVTEYSATNPPEDIAESFAMFVMKDKPIGKEIKDEKVNFFYQFKELVEYRDFVRENLGI